MSVSRQLPALDPDNLEFWTGGKDGQLRICFCPACGNYQHPPLPVCPCCGVAVERSSVSGEATVVTYSVNWQPWYSGQIVPFVLAVVELVEQQGLWLMTNIVDCQADEVSIGMPVSVTFLQVDDVWLPLFRPKEKP